MPRRDDIQKIAILGSGPIIIGQAAEFDYSGVQACRVLQDEGYEIVLINSNPATIMTDPEFASNTYVEPLTPDSVTAVLEKERPDALLATLGGGTALNLARILTEDGTLERLDIELIGANYESMRRAEERELFRTTVHGIGLQCAKSTIVQNDAGGTISDEELDSVIADVGIPAIIRPGYTMGGFGGGIAYSREELKVMLAQALDASPIREVLVEQSLLGWGEFELELMRDKNDNVVVICSIENIDPMGVHTGDSVTVAPQQTLSDAKYQELRDQSIAVIRAVGVETGGSNIQFAVNPDNGDIVVIEMNPRVSRSSALASKATGFPIAKIAARLAVGYTLEEIPNDITQMTTASFEPTLDYVVVKWPRFAFEKFAGADAVLTSQMKSVGEAMAIAPTFKQAFEKAWRSRELDKPPQVDRPKDVLLEELRKPGADRFEIVFEVMRKGATIDEVHEVTNIDPWYLTQFAELIENGGAIDTTDPSIQRVYRAVDTCAAEFAAATPYFYSGYERVGPDGPRHEVIRGDKPSVIILGSGPNRVGQGIEFDYCCVHAAMTVREMGRDAVIVNCNPETVSTDYDISDRLYFEPLTLDDVLAIVEIEQPEGVIVQFGGQTPLKLAEGLAAAGVPLLGTGVDAIDLAEDRERWGDLLDRVGIACPPYGIARSSDEARITAERVGFPLLIRPSYVLGGRAMTICYTRDQLEEYLSVEAKALGLDEPIPQGQRQQVLLLDRFLEDAIEIDVDALSDGETVHIGAVMQHVEEAGVHSGDSACVIPAMSLGPDAYETIVAHTRKLALELGVIGLINIQYAVAGDEIYVIEANPRASRTVPFVSKATGVSLAKIACRLMLGEKLADMDLPQGGTDHVSVKEAVLPFQRFPGADAMLGPEMRSTGEVMGIADDFPTAFGKAQAAAGSALPDSGTVFITVRDRDKPAATQLAATLHDLGFRIIATAGTARAIRRMGVPVEPINKIVEGSPHVRDWIERGDVDMVINTPSGFGARSDGFEIRVAATATGIPCITTMTGASAAARAIAAMRQNEPTVRSLQELHAERLGDTQAAPA
ncbi:MAG TPA: carbamoyl-phosphate synthase large subunit [Solirubrobacterales bacterium]|jgi:carbamoyl-phosphate synthase large subunit|nr:carbamoyl-phosphate synthase large subunit [Solirubrobacterales bacterium]